MARRLRKHPQNHPSETESSGVSRRRRLPYGYIWLLLTVVILILVINYDRRSIHDAEAHIKAGQALESKGLFMEALNEYGQAVENKRLGRKAKGDAALSMAEIYYNNLEDYVAANRYYIQARQIHTNSLMDSGVKSHAKMAAIRAKGSGTFKSRNSRKTDGVTTKTIIQRVELLSPPQMDQRGPVVASYNGGEVRAGELYRALKKRPEFMNPDFRDSPEKLKAFLDSLVRDNLAYEAAVSADVHKDSDLSAKLYDYQRSLITQRYLVDRREQALVVDNGAVEKYYKDHIGDYVKPGSITAALIQSDSQTSAAEYLQMLRDGKAFQDVASSYSLDEKSATAGGSIGTIAEKDTAIAGVGEAPELIKGLFKLPVHSVSEVTPLNGSFYIFKVTSVQPAQNTTVGEAHGRIENILRGQAVDKAKQGLSAELDKAFEPNLDEDGLKRFWDFVARESEDESTTASAQTTTGTLQTTNSVEGAPKS